MPFLFWRAIRGAKDAGLEAFDLVGPTSTSPG